MSKPKTLFDFFPSPSGRTPTSTPATKNTESAKKKSPKTPNRKAGGHKYLNGTSAKRPVSLSPTLDTIDSTQYDDDDNEEKQNGKILHTKPKKRRIIVASDSEESGDEYKPGKTSENEESYDDDKEEYMLSEPDSEPERSKPKKKTKKATPRSRPSPKVTPKSSKILNSSSKADTSVSADTSADVSVSIDYANKEWPHLTLDWLKPDQIRDKEKRLRTHPDYDPKTLYVPESFKKNLTPGVRQWWEMKSDHFDSVIFFKVGKFYELYHMDAVIGVNELRLAYMKGDFAHSGFPEIAYGRCADTLVQKEYKVARVEQTETPAMMEERCRNMVRPTKFDKVVSREICQITSQGTRTFRCQDDIPLTANSNFLLLLTEKINDESSWSESEYGVCFIDTSHGKFYIGQFSDDRHCSRLRTLTAHYPPVEILYERDAISKKTLQTLNSNLSTVNKRALASNSKYWDTSKVLKFLLEQRYFSTEHSDGDAEWPEVIAEMLDEDDRLQETPKKGYELAMKAFSGCVWYLKECLIEDQLLTMRLFEKYVPLDNQTVPIVQNNEKQFKGKHMILDGITLRNLEILENTSIEVEGTLYQTMDFCSTNFGKRLFRQWLCSPLCDPEVINDRLNAIEDLENISYVVDEVVVLLKKLPDLEKLLCRNHTQGLSRSKDHPEKRAIFFDEETYSKRRINDFLSILDGFKRSIDIVSQFDGFVKDFKSSLLALSLTAKADGGLFPSMKDSLDYFDEAFDHEQAKKDGCIIPNKGVDAEYDAAIEQINEAQVERDDYLREQRKIFQCLVTYFGTGRNRFQLEVPDSAAKYASDKYELYSQRKGFKRFCTEKTKEMLARLTAAEEKREAAQLDIMRRIFNAFDKKYDLWKSAVHCLSVLDVLISFMLYKKSSEVTMCRPEIVLPKTEDKAFLKIINGRHPSLLKSFTGDTYIPNSVYLGSKQDHSEENINSGGNIVLVTGPNMGGKSTLMRQTGLLVIMAQMGSYVPAEKCVFTSVDRIFTRVGASDCITAGESTFFVEVSETACILQHGTPHSLVLIDELGRGTSTYDGTAIAYAVVKELACRLDCRTLFSTHYHNLVEEFTSYPNVGLGHMACMVESDDDHPALENITFLYKFMNGMCPKSYGFNVAHLAGIPKEIIQKAYNKARDLEQTVKFIKLFRELVIEDELKVLQRFGEIRNAAKELKN